MIYVSYALAAVFLAVCFSVKSLSLISLSAAAAVGVMGTGELLRGAPYWVSVLDFSVSGLFLLMAAVAAFIERWKEEEHGEQAVQQGQADGVVLEGEGR